MVMLYALLALLIVMIVLLSSVRIRSSDHSRFELERTKQLATLHRDERVTSLIGLQRTSCTVLLLTMGYISVVALGWGKGVVLAFGIVLIHVGISRQKWVNQFAQKYYNLLEPQLLRWIDQAPFIFSAIAPEAEHTPMGRIESKEHLLDMVDDSKAALTSRQKALIRNSLSSDGVRVEQIMQNRESITSVASNELLGPVVINDLHKTGHSRFPVIKGDIDHIVGVLHLRDFLVLDSTKHSVRVDRAMESNVLRINQSDTIYDALEVFLKERNHFAIVVSDENRTVGVVSIEDIIAKLVLFE